MGESDDEGETKVESTSTGTTQVQVAGVGNSAGGLLNLDEQRRESRQALQTSIDGRAGSAVAVFKQTKKLTSPWRTLGGLRETQGYEMKHLALTDSDQYMRRRKAASKIVEGNVNDAFEATNKAYLEAGFSRAQAEEAGMKNAESVMDTQLRAMKLQFGEAEDSVVTGAAARSSGNMFTGSREPKMTKK